jgi:hypothetical protein
MTDVCTCRTIALSGWDTVQQAMNPTCPLHATYTAAEVKVLTETALRLGRKEAGEEIAAAIENNHGWQTPAQQEALDHAARIARNLAYRDLPSQPPQDASDATSGVGGHQEVSETARSPQEPCGHPDCLCHRPEDQEDA